MNQVNEAFGIFDIVIGPDRTVTTKALRRVQLRTDDLRVGVIVVV